MRKRLLRGRSLTLVVAICGLGVLGCATPPGGTDGTAEALVDSDGDGLVDLFEDEIFTDADLEDTDGDGYLDGEEWALFTDPTDEKDYEYVDENGELLWDHQPYPEDLEGTGNLYGKVMADFTGGNHVGQQVSLYSFYGNVIQVFAAADS